MRLRWPALIVATLFAFEVARLPAGQRDRPPVIADAIEVQNIGYHLAHGQGYRFDWRDPGWRKPYEAVNGDGTYTFMLVRHGSYPTLFRPPLMPLLVAACEWVAPGSRVFLAWRVFDAACFAAATGLLCDAAVTLAGVGGAVAMVALVLFDPLLRRYVPGWWTEGLAFDGVSAVAWLLVRGRVGRRGGRGRFRVVAGVTVGLLCLTRAVFVPLQPILCLLLAAAEPTGSPRRSWRSRAVGAVVILLLACAVQLPWWARNVVVAHRFVPLGTQGGYNLPDQYGSWAVFYGGEWTGRGIRDAWTPDATHPAPLPPGYTEAEFNAFWGGDRRVHAVVAASTGVSTASELAVSDAGMRAAVAWVRAHPAAVPGLMVAKAVTLFRHHWMVLITPVIAAVVGWTGGGVPGGATLRLAGLAATYVLGVAVTHVVYERFLIPLLPAAYLVAAAGLGSLGRADVRDRLRRWAEVRGPAKAEACAAVSSH
jgi:hypothetical protein